MALEFLRDNAYKLGGDPEKITVWGESAGKNFSFESIQNSHCFSQALRVLLYTIYLLILMALRPSEPLSRIPGQVQCRYFFKKVYDVQTLKMNPRLPVPPLETYDRPGGPFSLLLNLTGCAGRSNPIDCLREIHIQVGICNHELW